MTKNSNSSEDLLGVIALGSIVGNFAQAISKKRLQDRHKELQQFAARLRNAYENLAKNYKITTQHFENVKSVNQQLWQNVQSMDGIIKTLQKQNQDLVKKISDSDSLIKNLRAKVVTLEGQKVS